MNFTSGKTLPYSSDARRSPFRLVRLWAVVAVATGLLAVGFIRGIKVWRQARVVSACTDFTFSRGETPAWTVPGCWKQYAILSFTWPQYSGGGGERVTAGTPIDSYLGFLHRRVSPSGQSRLVAAQAVAVPGPSLDEGDPGYDPDVPRKLFSLQFKWDVRPVKPLWQGPTSERTTGWRWFDVEAAGSVTLFCGQHDPANDSHFIFSYIIDGNRGTIDAWLQDDDTIRLAVRDGPLSGANSGGSPTTEAEGRAGHH